MLILLRLPLGFAFFKPFAEFFVDGSADLNQASLHPIKVLMKSDPENFFHGDETEIGTKLAGKTLGFHLVLKISSIDPGNLVKRMVERIDAKEDRSGKCLVLDQKFDHFPRHYLASIVFPIRFQRAA